MASHKGRNGSQSRAKIEELVSRVREHFQSRMFLSDMSLDDQIEHLQFEIYLRDALVTARHFSEKAEKLKAELVTKEIYLFAKSQGLLGSTSTAIQAHEREKIRLRDTSTSISEQSGFVEDRDEDQAKVEYGPPDLRQRHTYCAAPFEAGRTDNARTLAPYQSILGNALPVRRCYRISEARRRLSMEFPYAVNVIDTVLKPLLAKPDGGTVVEPTVIWGKPGLGKSRLAKRICEELGLHAECASVAGMAEDFLFGVSLGFASAKASIVTEGIKRSGSANPVIILDEIDKISENRKHGSVYDRLLVHLEKDEARNQFDSFLNTHVDTSKVGWLMTANDISGLPSPLRSRVRTVQMLSPRIEHIALLLAKMHEDMCKADGLDARWVPRFLPFEVEILQTSFAMHGSIRVLRRQAEVVLSSRVTVMQ